METDTNVPYNIEDVLTDNFIDTLFASDYLPENTERWMIIVKGKPLAIQGKLFYYSKQQATKAFYNSFSWRARWQIGVALNPHDSYGYHGTFNRAEAWRTFKRVLTDKYGFEIVQV